MNSFVTSNVPTSSGMSTRSTNNEEETLVADSRSGFTPSQMVEQRLIDILKSSSMLVSQVQRRLKPR